MEDCGEHKPLVERLRVLERTSRRLQQALMLVLVAAGAGIWMAHLAPAASVDGREFVLRDAAGQVRGIFGFGAPHSVPVFGETNTVSNVPSLTLFDTNGHARLRLSVPKDGPMLEGFDAQGRVQQQWRLDRKWSVRPVTER